MRATTDAAGAVTNTYKTDEFGVAMDTQGPSAQPHRYTGEPRDAESGPVEATRPQSRLTSPTPHC